MKLPLPLVVLFLALVSTLRAEGNLNYAISDEQGAKRIVTFYRRPPTDVTGYWTPTSGEVGVAEAGLAEFFASTPTLSAQAPEDYFRQYGGIVVGGERRLYISFVLRAVVDGSSSKGIGEPIIINDGGSSFWRVDYNPHTQTFSHWQSNGGPSNKT